MMTTMLLTRCPKTLRYSKIFSTRCVRPAGHGPLHTGRPLHDFSREPLINWQDGDPNEYESSRNDQWAWMESA